MPVEETGVKCVAFADDLKLYQSFDGNVDSKTLQTVLSTINDWANEWIYLSQKKKLLLRIGRRNSTMTYYIDKTPITKVEEVKELGFLATLNSSSVPTVNTLQLKHSRRCINCLDSLLRMTLQCFFELTRHTFDPFWNMVQSFSVLMKLNY